MKYIFIYAIILFVIGYIIKLSNENTTNKNYNDNVIKYLKKANPMTETEQKFVKQLKTYTDKYNLIILPQVQLQSIFKTINPKDITSFNKIKSKSIDFAIVDEQYNYKLFIELDDHTHNKRNRIKRDIFINNLFNTYKINLKRIKVQKEYDKIELEKIITEIVI